MKVWTEFFFKYDKDGSENEILKSCFNNYNAMSEMIQLLKENQLFEKLSKNTQDYIKSNFT